MLIHLSLKCLYSVFFHHQNQPSKHFFDLLNLESSMLLFGIALYSLLRLLLFIITGCHILNDNIEQVYYQLLSAEDNKSRLSIRNLKIIISELYFLIFNTTELALHLDFLHLLQSITQLRCSEPNISSQMLKLQNYFMTVFTFNILH